VDEREYNHWWRRNKQEVIQFFSSVEFVLLSLLNIIMKKELTIFLGMVSASCLAALPAISQTFSSEIHARLASLDREVSQGHFRFDRRFQSNHTSSLEEHKFFFNNQHCYRDSFDLSDALHSHLTSYFDGTDSFLNTGKSIIIKAGLPSDASYDQSLMDVTPYPSFPMGRGLSSLVAFAAVRKGKWIEVKGHTLGGIYITAKVDPNDHDLAREIEMRNVKGDWEGLWRTHGDTLSGAIVNRSIYTPSRSNHSQSLTFDFISADLLTPRKAEFDCVIKGNLAIVDQRLGGSVTIKKPTQGIISKNEILDATRSVLEKRGQQQRTSKLVETIQNIVNALFISLPLILLGVWFSLRRSKTALSKTT